MARSVVISSLLSLLVTSWTVAGDLDIKWHNSNDIVIDTDTQNDLQIDQKDLGKILFKTEEENTSNHVEIKTEPPPSQLKNLRKLRGKFF